MPLINPRIDNLYATKITQVIEDLSTRYTVEAELEDEARCPNCKYDSVRKCGTGTYNGTGPNPFDKVCPVCRNKGNVKTSVRQEITASVQLSEAKKGDMPTPGGDLPEGHARIKGLVEEIDVLEAAVAFYIDGVRYDRIGQIKQGGLLTKVRALITVKRSD